jgi:hypothetical protein
MVLGNGIHCRVRWRWRYGNCDSGNTQSVNGHIALIPAGPEPSKCHTQAKKLLRQEKRKKQRKEKRILLLIVDVYTISLLSINP